MGRLAAIVFLLVVGASAEMRVSLDGGRDEGSWVVWNEKGNVRTSAKVPGGIYTDLQSGGFLSDNLFFRFNDMEYRWVAKDDWTYQTAFDLPSPMLDKQAINLLLHGVDTIGEVHLNGELLSEVDNMFVRYVLPIKGIAREKNNTLQVRLKSPIREADRLSQDQNRSYTIPPQCTPSYYNGECHVNFLRKMQASFSWDWGPAFPSVGLWKGVEVEAFNAGVVRDVTATTFKVNAKTWRVNATAFTEHADGGGEPSPAILGRLVVGDVRQNEVDVKATVGETRRDESPNVKNGYVTEMYFLVDESAIQQWWPNGFGEQPLYDLTVSLESADRTERSTKTIKIGFRTIELVQEKLHPDKPGLSFFFKVNDVPIFAKGSNWIPGHILPELGYEEPMLRHALSSAKDAHMNMLRVWGGGVYESDAFYRIADELGILIWQDMMFACSMYPTDENFLKSVRKETEQQIRRLQHHPSIALWAGNNENELALRQNWYGTLRNFNVFKRDYVTLYVDTIKPVVEANDKSRPYLISSPSNGPDSVREGYVANDPGSPLFGDVHHYEYILDGWNSNVYPDARFVSEYGFQSMPSLKTMSSVSLPEDRNLLSKFTKKRQHHLIGDFSMLSLIHRNLPHFEPDSSEESYGTFIYYSQISQAMSIKAETEKYRRDRSKLTSDNMGHTMGAMYWQLNDVWQAPSWSSIEFGGKWKMLHYFAKKFFSPVLISPEVTPTGDINIFLVSDLLEDVPGVQLNISVYSWEAFTPLKTRMYQVELPKATSTHIFCVCDYEQSMHKALQISDLLAEANCRPEDCFLHFTVEAPNIFSDNFIFPVKLHKVKKLKRPQFSTTVTKSENANEVLVRLTTDRIAAFVWLETDEEGQFSDNGFLLIKKEVDLKFMGKNGKEVDVEKLRSTLTIRSLESSEASVFKRHLTMATTLGQGLVNLALEGLKRVFP